MKPAYYYKGKAVDSLDNCECSIKLRWLIFLHGMLLRTYYDYLCKYSGCTRINGMKSNGIHLLIKLIIYPPEEISISNANLNGTNPAV